MKRRPDPAPPLVGSAGERVRAPSDLDNLHRAWLRHDAAGFPFHEFPNLAVPDGWPPHWPVKR